MHKINVNISLFYHLLPQNMGVHGGSVVENLPTNAGDTDSIPRSGRSTRGGNGNSLQYSQLGIPWSKEPGQLQSMELQKSWIQISN